MEKTKTKKQKAKPFDPSDFQADERNTEAYRDAVWRQLCKMKHKDLQKACILRGLAPEDVVGFDHHKLVVWFYDNYNNGQDENLLKEFDIWKENEFIKNNIPETDPIRNPVLRLSYVEPIIEGVEPPKPPKLIPEKAASMEPKPKGEKHDAWGIKSGTKKFRTYELAIRDRKNMEEVIKIVMDEYPDAQDKSIKIWWKRAIKLIP